MRYRTLVIAASIAALAACSSLESGDVIQKDYRAGHMETQTSTYCNGSTCTPVTHLIWVGPQWELKLRNGDETDWVSVDETTYHRYYIGTHYPDAQ